MTDAKNNASKKRGRPLKGGAALGSKVGMRWSAEDLAKIDAYAEENGLERTDAIRELVRLGLIKAEEDDE